MRFKVKPQPCYWDRKTVIRFDYWQEVKLEIEKL
jgi:hypothetical protein